MDKGLRIRFNENFVQKNYDNFIKSINENTGNRLDFRICETPLFLTPEFTEELLFASNEIIDIISHKSFFHDSSDAVPKELFVPNESDHPQFIQIDFGITTDTNGNLLPQLIELQGFPSLYAYQAFLDRKIKEFFQIPENYTSYFNGLNFESYIKILHELMVGDSKSENVILLEIQPEKQKTRIDFYLTEKYWGIKSVCVTEIVKEGRRLFYKKDGRLVLIEKIYNRVIFDELFKKDIHMQFSFTDDLDVEWIGHPNWFYKLSKHSLPKLKSRFNPVSYYLSKLDQFPVDLENYVLKPLYSFAGSGIVIDVDRALLDKIENRNNYILQKKVDYMPVIETPDGKSKVEIRMMYIWDKEPLLVNNLLRTSKGKMMGVDFNKNQSWIGSSTVFHPVINKKPN